MVAGRELRYRANASATDMAETIFGSGVEVIGATYTGDSRSSAIYERGNIRAPETTPGNEGVILSTGRAKDFTNKASESNLAANTTTDTNGVDGEAGFDAVAGVSTFDAAYLDVSFTSAADTISIYNDFVAVWIDGTYVPLSVGNGKVSVENLGEDTTPNLYKDNATDAYNTEMDGFTVTLALTIPIARKLDTGSPAVNTIRIGISDTAFVNLETIPCFLASIRIATPDGDRRIKELSVGDLVIVEDSPPHPIRWAGIRTLRAEGRFAPNRIMAGALGDHGQLLVSPLDRILIRDKLADLRLGEPEVPGAARHLVNDSTIRPEVGSFVTYVHLLFDRHEVVLAEGLPTESFLPGPESFDSFEAEVLEEIRALFPELDPATGLGDSPAARRTLRGYEARLLMAEVAA